MLWSGLFYTGQAEGGICWLALVVLFGVVVAGVKQWKWLNMNIRELGNQMEKFTPAVGKWNEHQRDSINNV